MIKSSSKHDSTRFYIGFIQEHSEELYEKRVSIL